jgi:phage-related protein
MNFTYEFAKISGRIPMIDYLESLSVKDRAKIFVYIEKLIELKNRKMLPNTNLSKHLEDGIFELRIKLENKLSRCLYFYMKGENIVFTHGFTKKSQKTPKSEIEKAKSIKKIMEV